MPYKYPDNIENPEFKNRRIKINIYEQRVSKDAKEAYTAATELVQKIDDLVPFENSTLEELTNNLKANANSRLNGNLIDSIVLPMPNNFQDQQSHSWSTESGILGTMGKSFTSMNTGGVVGSVLSGSANAIKNLIPGAKKLSNFGTPTFDLSVDKVVGAASSTFGLRKPIIDPGYFQNYTGSEPRQFSTEFNLIPSSAKEAESILSIIMKLKQYSSPYRKAGVSLLAPYYFGLEFSNKLIGALIKVDRLVIKDMTLEYGADGAMQMTGDGVPKYITLNLAWQEVNLTTANEYSHIPAIKEK